MAVTPSNPHDAYFRQVLGQPANAASQLRTVLPEAVAARLDWDRLELLSCSFVSKELRSSYGDLVFRTSCAGHDAFIYVLIEHQSCSDRMMPLRMLGYVSGIWNHFQDQNPDARTLPMVIPVVVHNNSTGRAWSAPTELADLYDADPTMLQLLGPHLPRFQFLLDDVATIDVAALQARPLTRPAKIVLYLQKADLRNTNARTMTMILEPLEEDFRELATGPDGVDALIPHLAYILLVGDLSVDDLNPFFERVGPQAKEALMTTAERLRAEGEARGIAIGAAQAWAAILIDQMTLKFGRLPTHILDHVRSATPIELHVWARRVITATSLDEMFVD
ncbi:Rpn family recombination-promoting nuclease/putative transposase [Nocardia sp. XZ_19_385]|uniref:Rpn family recombination-promoting nuclease/putative transposase n=1 Tax=Nocardia sp. XZ_19_385 TaxID=2769488 RepID=UPI00188F3D90|nr:Rpn family recombination-promoting nuclease/putative transposase [Nocardia sp. XZ_19_385]